MKRWCIGVIFTLTLPLHALQEKYSEKEKANINKLVDGDEHGGYGKEQITPLMKAVRERDVKMIKKVLSLGGDPNSKSKVFLTGGTLRYTPESYKTLVELTPFQWSLQFEAIPFEIIQLLVENGAKDTASGDGLITVTKANKFDIVKLLVEKGVSNPATAQDVLMFAVITFNIGNLNLLNYLIDKGAKDTSDKALYYAITGDKLDMVKALVERGGSNLAMPYIFEAAVKKGNQGLVNYLIGKGMFNAKDSAGNTLLLNAIINDKSNIAKLLLDPKNNPKQFIDMQNNDGMTALMVAADKGNVDMVNLLLNAGANKNLTDKKGRNATGIASTKSNSQLLQAFTK